MSEWILGFDAGGTRTRAALAASDGGALFRAAAGPCNWTMLTRAECLGALDAAAVALDEPFDAAEVAAVCLCSAGYFAPHHETLIREGLAARWPNAALRVETDLVAAWAGSLAAAPGVVVIAGTGSVAYGRAADGHEARAGGWGPLFDDAGSGYWLACRGLAAVAEAIDGRGPATLLAQRMPAGATEGDPALWLRDLLRSRPGRRAVAALALAVLACAAEGDEVAEKLVEAGAAELARMARAVERRLADPAAGLWSWAGGLLTGSEDLRRRVQGQLLAEGSALQAQAPVLPADAGALILAEELLGGTAVRGRLLADEAGGD